MGGKRNNRSLSGGGINNNGAKRGKLFSMTSYGIKGLMISCSTSKVKESERETFYYLDEWIEKLYPNIQEELPTPIDKDNNTFNKEDVSISSAFDAELKELKSKSKTKSLYERMDFVFGGLFFVHFLNDILDPVLIASSIMEDIIKTNSCTSRFTVRIIPVQMTCKHFLGDILDAVKPLVTNFINEKMPKTFGVLFKGRGSSFDRMELIKEVAKVVGSCTNNECKVDIKNAEMSIMIENVVCLSVIRDYNKYSTFSIYSILGLGNIPSTKNEEKIEELKEEIVKVV